MIICHGGDPTPCTTVVPVFRIPSRAPDSWSDVEGPQMSRDLKRKGALTRIRTGSRTGRTKKKTGRKTREPADRSGLRAIPINRILRAMISRTLPLFFLPRRAFRSTNYTVIVHIPLFSTPKVQAIRSRLSSA